MNRAMIHLISAARPNFMKVAPLYHALKNEDWCAPVLVHTGQHYDINMSDTFISDMKLPNPDISLGIRSGTHAEQTAGVMIAYEKVCLQNRPDWVIVVGDVNSTMACAITAKKLCLRVAHLEAGLRSGDRTMPEELNRIITDAISDILWTPSLDADENLRKEGVDEHRIVYVGNIMIDSYEMLKRRIEKVRIAERLGFSSSEYGVVTLHRPLNVDDEKALLNLVKALIKISSMLPLVFPVHPRTKSRLEAFNLWEGMASANGIHMIDPLGYIEFMGLVKKAKLVITDSGGIQEETTYLNIPCLTLRDTTERPITVTQGTNRLVNKENVIQYVEEIIDGQRVRSTRPKYWDGKTAVRVAESLKEIVKGTCMSLDNAPAHLR